MGLWSKYKKHIERNLNVSSAAEFQSLDYWRNKLFVTTLIYLLPVSLIAWVPGVVVSLIGKLPLLALLDTVALFFFVFIVFNARLKMLTRKILFVITLYSLSVVLLFFLGALGPGLLYLLAVSIYSGLIFPIRFSRYSIIANLIFCILFGLVIQFEWIDAPLVASHNLGSWIAVSSNLVFLSAISVYALDILFTGLETTIQSEARVKEELQEERATLVKALDMLQDKNNDLEQFSYVTSHDLQEPLRMVTNHMKVFKRKYGDQIDASGHELIDFAVDGALRMRRLIDGLLVYSRISTRGKEFVSTDLTQLLQDTLLDLSLLIEQTGAQISYDSLPTLSVDAAQISLVFQNLIKNAIQFCDEQPPQIKIKAQEMNKTYRFSVEDNGIGFDAERYAGQVFTIFQKLHPERKYEGAGVGLVVCKKILERHGGEIWAKSQEGAGSTFYFMLPKN